MILGPYYHPRYSKSDVDRMMRSRAVDQDWEPGWGKALGMSGFVAFDGVCFSQFGGTVRCVCGYDPHFVWMVWCPLHCALYPSEGLLFQCWP